MANVAQSTFVSNYDYLTQKQAILDSLKVARETKNYRLLATSYHHLADIESVYSKQKTSVIEYYNRAIEYYKLTDNDDSVLTAKLSIAEEYIKNGLLDDADAILEEVNAEYLSNKDQSGQLKVSIIQSSIAIEENNLRQLEVLLEKIDQYYTSKDVDMLPYIILLRSNAMLLANDQEGAEAILADNTELLSTPDNATILQARAHIIIGKIRMRGGQWDEAITHLTNAEDLVKHLPLSKLYQEILYLIQTVYHTNESYDSAYTYATREAKLKDSLLNRVRVETISNLSEKYKSKEKSTEIKVLEIEKKYAEEQNQQQQRALYVLVFILLLLSGLIYFTIRFYRNQMNANKIISSQESQISEQKILKLEDEIKLKGMHSMIEGQESERERISKDLHDSLGGLLSAIKLQLAHIPIDETNAPAIETQHHVQELLDSAVNEVRSISSNLQPVSLKNLGLVAAVSDLMNRYRNETYPDIEFQHYNVPKQMDNMVALSIYRIIQELLNNTVKHAHANEIHLQLRGEDNILILQYEDDGIGFDLESLKKRGMGLENITSRVSYLKGELSIDARLGGGVSYVIDIDLGRTEQSHVV